MKHNTDTQTRIQELELLGQNTEYHEAFLDLYVRLMPEYTNYVDRMRQRMSRPVDADAPDNIEHYRLYTVAGQAAGLATYKYLPGRQCGLGIDLAISRAFRSEQVQGHGRFAAFIIAAILRQINLDAERMNQPQPLGLFVEVGAPRLIVRYEEYGFIEIPIEYYEPNVPEGHVVGKDDLDPSDLVYIRRHVGLFPSAEDAIDLTDQSLIEKLARAFLLDHYQLPEDNWAVQRTMRSIRLYCEKRGYDGIRR